PASPYYQSRRSYHTGRGPAMRRGRTAGPPPGKERRATPEGPAAPALSHEIRPNTAPSGGLIGEYPPRVLRRASATARVSGAGPASNRPAPMATSTPPQTAGNGAPLTKAAKGLEGVIALESSICHIDGAAGELIYRGYEIDDLARNATFEEVAYLLWH